MTAFHSQNEYVQLAEQCAQKAAFSLNDADKEFFLQQEQRFKFLASIKVRTKSQSPRLQNTKHAPSK